VVAWASWAVWLRDGWEDKEEQAKASTPLPSPPDLRPPSPPPELPRTAGSIDSGVVASIGRRMTVAARLKERAQLMQQHRRRPLAERIMDGPCDFGRQRRRAALRRELVVSDDTAAVVGVGVGVGVCAGSVGGGVGGGGVAGAVVASDVVLRDFSNAPQGFQQVRRGVTAVGPGPTTIY
jgi:hypothetical protein